MKLPLQRLPQRRSEADRKVPSCGFTLVELIASIVIVGILGAIAVPRLLDTQPFNERGYIDEVASSIRYAQKIAIASRCDVSVAIAAASYTVMQRDSHANCINNTRPWTTPVLRADGTALAGTAPTGIVMAPAATIIFDQNGRIAGNPPAFTVGPFTMTVAPATGLVTLQP